MNRTLGFFLGSAAVFAMLVYMLGQPVPLASPHDRDGAALAGAVVPTPPDGQPGPAPLAAAKALADAPGPEEMPSEEVADEVALVEEWLQVARDSTEQAGPPAPSAVDPAPAAPSELAEAEPAASAGQTDVPVTTAPGNPAIASDIEWFPVWDPFHSELSANAFARRLERITGLDYRVIRTDRARYRVAVGYASEEQRLAHVAAIEEATGLTITGGSR
ncbi:MAG: hypothetical protein HKN06_12355 [Gammaproteobacteria bacterium]|nr:hypothetical protein [Gammaproteobacteria bacterium]